MCKHRTRVKPAWQPEWSTGIEKWTAARINENLWRFDRVEEFKDVMQQARILFWKLSVAYPIVNNPHHFFALYKTSLLRHFVDKARKRSRSVIDQDTSLDDLTEIEFGHTINAGQLHLLLEEMPDELKIVFGSLTSGRVRLKLDRPTTSKRYRENYNMRLKRRLSLTMADPVGALREYLTANI